jgi:hypothetical protein
MADNIIRKKDGDEFMDCLQNREFDLIETTLMDLDHQQCLLKTDC